MMESRLFMHMFDRQKDHLKKLIDELENKISFDSEDRAFLELRAIEIAQNLKRLRQVKNNHHMRQMSI